MQWRNVCKNELGSKYGFGRIRSVFGPERRVRWVRSSAWMINLPKSKTIFVYLCSKVRSSNSVLERLGAGDYILRLLRLKKYQKPLILAFEAKQWIELSWILAHFVPNFRVKHFVNSTRYIGLNVCWHFLSVFFNGNLRKKTWWFEYYNNCWGEIIVCISMKKQNISWNTYIYKCQKFTFCYNPNLEPTEPQKTKPNLEPNQVHSNTNLKMWFIILGHQFISAWVE